MLLPICRLYSSVASQQCVVEQSRLAPREYQRPRISCSTGADLLVMLNSGDDHMLPATSCKQL